MVTSPSSACDGPATDSGCGWGLAGAARAVGADWAGSAWATAPPLRTRSENPSVSMLSSSSSDSSMMRRISRTSSWLRAMLAFHAEGPHHQRDGRAGRLGLGGLVDRRHRARLDHEHLARAGDRPLHVLMGAEVALDPPAHLDQRRNRL